MITRKEIDLAVDCPELTAAQQKNFYRLIRKTDSRFISGDTDTPKK